LRRPALQDVTEQFTQYRDAIVQSLARNRQQIPARHVERFERELKAWSGARNAVLDESARTITRKLVLKNVGKAPARGVRLSIAFPDILSSIICYGGVSGKRALPVDPPETYGIALPETRSLPANLNLRDWVPSISLRDRNFVIDLEIIPHGDKYELQDFYLTFDGWESVRPFTADVWIRTLDPADDNQSTLLLKAKRAE
jgi:hypothetical protein